MRRRPVALFTVALFAAAGCQAGSDGGGTSDAATAPADPTAVSGTITVLTNRTDMVESGAYDAYAERFNKIYPNVKVEFEGSTDYEGETKIRLSSDDYGDVLLIPNAVEAEQYPQFFAPLGAASELSKKYDFTDRGTVEGKVYGLASIASAQGFVYNKAVWEKAGITDWPRTPDEFLADLKVIRNKTDATPYYTNYHDLWPLTNWGNAVGSTTCDPAASDNMADTDELWKPGQELHTIDSLLYDIVDQGLAEEDPTTTNWEKSKDLIGTGKVATMQLGSWAVTQMRQAAQKAGKDPADIGFMPFPSQNGDQLCTSVRPDYQLAVNKHSNNKAAARAWVDWFINESGDAQDALSISTVKGSPLPEPLKPFEAAGVRLINMDSKKTAEVNAIDKASEIGLSAPDYRQHLIDVARGAAKGDLDSDFAELNQKWSEARAGIG
ncbi:ABC transporter substrate-binding protein [Streptomyces sp. NPDC088387]|uniref:ABC transporter substrate-binding protein n=1 Tax=Streptomyces sp. NPDC088387 TaxID=3365859 RepID=UPI00381AA9E9